MPSPGSTAIPRRLPAALGGLALLLTLAPSSLRGDGRDEWHKLLIGGKPAGHIHMVETPRKGGGYVVAVNQKLVLRRGGTVIETEGSSSVDEDAGGRVVGFRMVQKLSKQVVETVGVLDGDALAVTDTVGGEGPRMSRIPVDPSAVGLHRAAEVLKEKLRRPGDSTDVRVFVPETRKFGWQHVVFLGEEDVALPSGKHRLRHLVETLDILPGIDTHQWVDLDFELQKSSFALLGMEMTTLRSTLAEVLAADLASPPEIYFSTSIPVARSVPPDAKEATYRFRKKVVTPAEKKEASKLFRAAGQEVLDDAGAITVVRVRRVQPSKSARPVRPVPETPELRPYLRPNTYIQSDDGGIRRIALLVVKEEKDPWTSASLLKDWVHKHVKTKNLNTGFATAKEVAANLEGDCTEHAVLLAALLRAAGLPSRVVAGAVLHEGAFVGHMWTEVHAGEWIPLDATRPEREVGPDHVGFTTSALDAANVVEIFLGIVPVIGNVAIDVVEVVE